MIKIIDNENMILDRTKVSETHKSYNGSIVTLPESAYQQLSEEVKNNGVTYLTYNDEEPTD